MQKKPIAVQEESITPKKALPKPLSARLKNALVFALLPALGVVTAFAVAPATRLDTVLQQEVTETVPARFSVLGQVQQGAPLMAATQVERGDTLGSLLARLGVQDAEAQDFILRSAQAKSFLRLDPGVVVQVQLQADAARVMSLRSVNREGLEFMMYRAGDRFSAFEQPAFLTLEPVTKTFTLSSDSFYESADAAGLSDVIAEEMAKALASQVNFVRGLRRGDRFTVVYEQYSDATNTYQKPGKLLAVEVQNQGVITTAISFTDPATNHTEYYTPEGQSLRKAFLRAPVDFVRITSGFSQNRLHPVLGYHRAHRGVDYAGPTGTPIKAVANAVVKFAGTQSGYGNVVELQHEGPYSTLYAHMSAFAKGIRVGDRIKQGDVIGYVGSTGVSTGPHLHYEFKVNGEQIDPETAKVAFNMPLSNQNQAQFEVNADFFQHQMALLSNARPANFE